MTLIAYQRRKNFSQGTVTVIDKANEILEEYGRAGYDLTLRQLYYQFVSRGLIANSDREYNKLGRIVNDARMGGLIDWNHIIDRTRFLRHVSSWENPESIIRGAAHGYKIDLWEGQPARCEVWVEKDALVGVIERACDPLRVPYLSCRGYTSQSEMWTASQRLYRLADAGQVVHVFHLGDHDPSGLDMSRDIEDRLFTFMANDRHRKTHDPNTEHAVDWVNEMFRFERLALHMDQVERYDPPPNPAKLTDSRGAGYVEEYGNYSWELDALEPQVIGDLIENAVLGVRDPEAWRKSSARETMERAALEEVSKRWSDVAAFIADTHTDTNGGV